MDLERLGWDAAFAAAYDTVAPAGAHPARVVVQQPDRCVVTTGADPVTAVLPGRFRREGVRPVTGDWVAVRADGASAVVAAVLPRRTALTRKAAGRTSRDQVLAANADLAFVVAPLDRGLVRRWLERFVTIAWDSGAEPLVLLTKADLVADLDAVVADAYALVPGADVLAVSVVTGRGMAALQERLVPARTAVLLGASGAGKSSLVNALLGREHLAVRGIRTDGRGRHTTTSRELVVLPQGGLVLDMPGVRELGVSGGTGGAGAGDGSPAPADSSSGLSETFSDVEELAGGCRFGDCTHESEPGCAVREAVAAGALRLDRLAGWRHLQRELHWLRRRQDARLAAEERKKWKRITTAHRPRTARG
jgi:ribosome biogenesis GTPase